MNIHNLKAVVDHAEQYPEEYDQEHYCGTARCIAGLAQKIFFDRNDIKTVCRDAAIAFGMEDQVYECSGIWLVLDRTDFQYITASERTLDEIKAFIKEKENA